ncbi:MAG: cytochrome c [Aureliella sp.]
MSANGRTRCCLQAASLAALVAFSGCEVPVAKFQPNVLQAKLLAEQNSIDMAPAVVQTQAALEDMFGTPDDPKWPAAFAEEEDLANLVSLERLQRAAGPVRSDEHDVHFGLFREHCVNCHGTTGNGLGPTATFLNPYPRDFRLGVFKFKSTPFGRKPTRTDLKRIVREGIMGTSMPSFRLLKEEDVDALVDYVIYLSVRGEVERKLLQEGANLDFTAGENLYNPKLKESDPDEFEAEQEIVDEILFGVAESWDAAADQAITVEAPPEDYPLFTRDAEGSPEARERLAESIASGRNIFHGNVANCATCHGSTGLGDGQKNDYDAWTKDWLQPLSLDAKDKEQIAPYLKLGALKPRHIIPRNLRSGMYRGGGQPVDIYMRIVLGIDGTTMPAAPLKPDNPLGLTQNQVWDVVNYVLSLPYEHISNASAGVPPFARENP